MEHLPQLIKDKTLREEVHKLPDVEFSEKTLKSLAEWQRAYVVLTFLSQGYVWMEGESGLVNKVPEKLAVPWCAISEHVQLPPVTTYATTVLYNYALRDPKGPITEDNLYAVSTFTGTESEDWFYVVPVLIEMAAVPGLKAIEHACGAMDHQKNSCLAKDLLIIASTLRNMKTALNKMYEKCEPNVFYVDVRPFQAGSKGLSAFPDGLIYEGVDSKSRQYNGASAAESSTLPSFDIFLGAKHTGSDLEFLETMRQYMPKRHREFLEALIRRPPLREYVKTSGDSKLVKAYNTAIDAFGEWRSSHVILVTRYIVMQKSNSVNACLDEKGTGGTPFMQFLKQVRDDTVELKISVE